MALLNTNAAVNLANYTTPIYSGGFINADILIIQRPTNLLEEYLQATRVTGGVVYPLVVIFIVITLWCARCHLQRKCEQRSNRWNKCQQDVRNSHVKDDAVVSETSHTDNYSHKTDIFEDEVSPTEVHKQLTYTLSDADILHNNHLTDKNGACSLTLLPNTVDRLPV